MLPQNWPGDVVSCRMRGRIVRRIWGYEPGIDVPDSKNSPSLIIRHYSRLFWVNPLKTPIPQRRPSSCPVQPHICNHAGSHMCETAEVPMGKTEVVIETEENDDALQEVQRPIGTHE